MAASSPLEVLLFLLRGEKEVSIKQLFFQSRTYLKAGTKPVMRLIALPMKLFCFRSMVCTLGSCSAMSPPETDDDDEGEKGGGSLITCSEPLFFDTTKYASRCLLIQEQLARKAGEEEEEPRLVVPTPPEPALGS